MTDFEADAANLSKENISVIVKHAVKMRDLALRILIDEEAIKKLKEQFAEIEGSLLPDAMTAAGIQDFTLNNGDKLKVKPVVKASLPTQININKQKDPEKKVEMQERLEAGVEYLRDNKAASLVKNQLVIDITAGMDNLATDIIERLKEEYNVEAERNVSVNTQSLSAWAREKLKAGTDIPHETFAVFSGRKATITKAG